MRVRITEDDPLSLSMHEYTGHPSPDYSTVEIDPDVFEAYRRFCDEAKRWEVVMEILQDTQARRTEEHELSVKIREQIAAG